MAVEQVRSLPKAPKIRLSCDSCQRSKIRCSQERPTCRRCLKYSIECIYSPSRRAGRPRLRRASTACQSPPSAHDHPQSQPPPATPQPVPSPQHQQATIPVSIPSPPGPEQRSPPLTLGSGSPPDDDNIVVASMRPEAAAVPTPASSGRLGQWPVPAADQLPDCTEHDASLAALTYLSATDGCSPMFPDVGSSEPSLSFDFFLTPLDGITFSSKTPTYVDSITIPDPSPSIGNDECKCSVTLLEQLAQSQRLHGQCTEQLASIASAISKSRPLLTGCFSLLSCSQCAPRFSSILMVCEALDRASIALEIGPLWDDVGIESRTACTAINTDMAGDGPPLRCGSYSVRGGDRRIMLRVLITKHLNELQAIMSKLQAMVDSPLISKSPLQKTCAGLVSRFATQFVTNVNLIKMLL